MRIAVIALLLLAGSVAGAAPRGKKDKAAPAPAKAPAAAKADASPASKEKTFDFAAMGIEGRVLAPQLLYLLGRIKVELEKGDLQGRSFVPEMVRSVEEGGL
jgi:hypothetical protein